MTKGKTIAIVLLIGILAAGSSYYFLVYKPAHPKKPEAKDPENGSNPGSNSGSGSNTGNAGSNVGGGMTGSVIGKSVYANQDNVKVLYKSDGSVQRTKNKGEFVGVIAGTQMISGSAFYTLGDGALVVAQKLVYTK